jgi:hypothetical protein
MGMNIVQKTKDATGIDLQRLLERFGAPTLIAVLILTQLEPKIDRGIQIADHVDAELTYLAVAGCAPPVRASPPAFSSLSDDALAP